MRNTSETLSDSEVVGRVRGGDVDAFEYLLTKYREHVLMIVSRHLPYQQVEETAHEVFIRAYRALPTYKNNNSFKQWLSTIATRACHDYWRKHYRSRELPMSSLSESHQEWLQQLGGIEADRELHEQGRRQEAGELLAGALAQLPADERMVMELVYLQELSGREAAALLGLSVANVKIKAFRARRKLRRFLAGMLSD